MQKAITPRLLKALFRDLVGRRKTTNSSNDIMCHLADLVLGAFFFAMRACEYSATPKVGRTRRIDMGGLLFRDRKKRPLPLTHPRLLDLAEYVTVTFERTKTAKKRDSRTQRRTGHRFLCPVLRLASAAQRIIRTYPDWKPNTPLSSSVHDGRLVDVDSDRIRHTLRQVCKLGGGIEKFGFHPHEIGNKSIRSGAAMALALNNHSPYKIMILGRWESEAFLAYIRPQVLEFANICSRDMINFDQFLDVTHRDPAAPPDQQSRRLTTSFDGLSSTIVLPSFHMSH